MDRDAIARVRATPLNLPVRIQTLGLDKSTSLFACLVEVETKRTRIPLAAGQNEGLAHRFRDLLVNRAVDGLQPNVAITGRLADQFVAESRRAATCSARPTLRTSWS